MKKIFISYRREDEPFATKLLYERLAAYFGKDDIFYDIGDIPKGAHFFEQIEQSIAQCGVAIAIIGSKWLTLVGADGAPRLNNPQDIVRYELEAALQRHIPILPVLINDAHMPSPDKVPNSLRELCFFQAQHVHSNDEFEHEVGEVIQFLIEKLRQPAQEVIAPSRHLGALGDIADIFGLMSVQLNSIDMVSANDGWIVGSQGTILRLTAHNGWVRTGPPVDKELRKVHALSANSAWVVGDAGVILRYDEHGWTHIASGISQTLCDVYMFDDQDGWAVGDEGTIVRCQNGTWAEFPSPFKKSLHCITMLSPEHGWAAGAEGVILEYDGLAWKMATQLDLDMIEDMFMLNDTTGWVVGYKSSFVSSASNVPVTSKPDATDATDAPQPPKSFLDRVATWGESAMAWGGRIYEGAKSFVGSTFPSGEIYVFTAGAWEQEPIPQCGALHAVEMTSAHDGWAVGGSGLGGVILRYQDGAWAELHHPMRGQLGMWLQDVAIVNDVKSWAVGAKGTILQFDLNRWSLHTSFYSETSASANAES